MFYAKLDHSRHIETAVPLKSDGRNYYLYVTYL